MTAHHWWQLIRCSIEGAAAGYILWLVGNLSLYKMLAEYWRQSCEDQQRTINRMLATPEIVAQDQREIFVGRQRPN